MKFNLKVQLTISYLIISVLLVLSLYFVSNYFFQKQFQSYVMKQQETKNKEIVQIITNAYGKDGEVPDISFFEEFGTNLLDQAIILSVYDTKNVQIFCMACWNRENCNHTINMMRDMMEDMYPNFKGEYIEEKIDIIKNGQKFGYVNIGYFGPFFYSESDQAFVKTYNNIFILITVLSLVVSISLGVVIASGISRPLKKVIDRTKAIATGDYSGRITVKRSDTKEITELANSVNNLTNELKNQLTIKKQMAGDFAHEFLTPLTTIQSNLEAMLDGVYEPTPERLETLKLEVERVSRMVYDIDKLVALTNENIELNKENFDLAPVIDQVLTTFEREIHNKKIKVIFPKKACLISANKDKISQVIINLISNAIKYTKDSGSINITLKQDKKNMTLVIADTGIGISAYDLPYIFEYLYRADKSRSRNTGGSGIGLYVVKNIIESHHGQIKVTSKVNVGTKFTVILPNK